MAQDGTVERAFEFARGGSCRTVENILRQLKVEGYGNGPQHLAGSSIRKQLNALMRRCIVGVRVARDVFAAACCLSRTKTTPLDLFTDTNIAERAKYSECLQQP